MLGSWSAVLFCISFSSQFAIFPDYLHLQHSEVGFCRAFIAVYFNNSFFSEGVWFPTLIYFNTYSDLSILKMEPCAKWGNNQSGQLVSEGHCLGKLWTEVLTPRLHLFVASFYGTQPHQRSKRPPLHSPHAWSTCVKTSCGGRHSYKSKEALIIHQSQSRTIQYQGVSTLKSGNSENKILLSLREENRVKFRYSEKAAKIWPIFHFLFDIT